MRVLVIGGTRFMGYDVVWRLLASGASVTLLNRGQRGDPFGPTVTRLRADRRTPDFARALDGLAFDAAIDFAAYNGPDVAGAVATLQDRVGHYIFISSGSVYLVREGIARPVQEPLSESAYAGPVVPPPGSPEDRPNWDYGTGKRAAEDTLREAWSSRRFPATRIRLPIVHGPRDPEGRLTAYLWRILDGGPVLLPDGGRRAVRHVYSGAVAQFLVGILGRPDTFGHAYNLSQSEMPTLSDLVTLLASIVGAPDRQVPITQEALLAAHLPVREISPLSGPWSSMLDPALAVARLGFRHEPLPLYADKIVAAALAHPPRAPFPASDTRSREWALAKALEG